MYPGSPPLGEQGDEDEQIDDIDDSVGKLYACLVSFTNEAANRIVRNFGDGNGVEARRRLHSEYDPTSSMRCWNWSGILDLKRRQYEMLTDRNGRRCQASDATFVAAMLQLIRKNLEETVVFANKDEGFQELYGRLLAYNSMKQSIQMSERKKPTRKDDWMEVDVLS